MSQVVENQKISARSARSIVFSLPHSQNGGAARDYDS